MDWLLQQSLETVEAVDMSTGVLLRVEHDSSADRTNKLLLQRQHKLQGVLDGGQFCLPGARRARRPHPGLLGPHRLLRLQTGLLRSSQLRARCCHEPAGRHTKHIKQVILKIRLERLKFCCNNVQCL